MSTAPYGVRLLVGAAATALEETIRLPQTILTYPMTLASQLAQLIMKMQQDLAELVNKGDETLEQWFPPKDEQPEWATFDEDLLEPPRRLRARACPLAASRDLRLALARPSCLRLLVFVAHRPSAAITVCSLATRRSSATWLRPPSGKMMSAHRLDGSTNCRCIGRTVL